MWRFLIFLVVVGLVAAGLVFADYQGSLNQPLALTDEQRAFTIEKGWSAKRVAAELESKGIIDKPHWFYLYARISKKGVGIKSGEFNITGNPTTPELIDTFVKGQTVQYAASIIEGSTFKQIRERLATNTDLEQSLPSMSDTEIMDELGLSGQHPEGLFFSDTYQFPKQTSDLDFLKRANELLHKVLTEEWENRQADIPLATPYEALILASIVEKETAAPEERPLIAGVFMSRLKIRMRLQTDPTVIYGMGDSYDGNIRRKDLTTDTPYNTYTRAGLPPTPISMVGREAINAVMHPQATSALYFVSRGDGTHQFSDTVEQLEARGITVQLTREPGGTDLGEQLRHLLLHASAPVSAEAELMMMAASRKQHVLEVIEPALALGHWVLCDRFADASFAYQGGGRELGLGTVAQLHDLMNIDLSPDLTFLLDMPIADGLKRMAERGKPDRIEKEEMAFFERARAAYLQRAAEQPHRVKVIDAGKPLEQVQQSVRVEMEAFLDKH